MPQIINSSGGGSNQPGKKPKKSGDGVKLSGDVSEIPKSVLIGGGILVLLFLVFMVDRFIVPLRPKPAGPGYIKIAPPPGYPDVAPYNSKEWQDGGKMNLPGMPPPEAMQKMNGGMPTPPPPAGR